MVVEELSFSILDILTFKGGQVELLSEEGGFVCVWYQAPGGGGEVMVAWVRQLLLFTYSKEELGRYFALLCPGP